MFSGIFRKNSADGPARSERGAGHAVAIVSSWAIRLLLPLLQIKTGDVLYHGCHLAPMRSPQGLILYARAALWYTGGTTHALLRSVDSGDTWTIDQMCDESLAYCRNWVGFYLTNQSNVWFAPRQRTNINFEAAIQRWDNSPWFPQVDTVWNETGALGLSISPDYASDRLLYASLYPTSPTLQTALIRSSDGGDTWQNGSTEGLCPGWAADMRFSPAFAEDRTVFALQQDAIFKSADGGATWHHLYPPGGVACQIPGPAVDADDLQLSPHYVSDGTAYVISYNDELQEGHLRISTDGGLSWQDLLRNAGHLDDLSVAASSSVPPLTLFLVRGQTGTYVRHYRSDDGGMTWRCLPLPPLPRAYLPLLLKAQ